MKKPLVFLVLSLAANAALLVTFFVRSQSDDPRPSADEAPAKRAVTPVSSKDTDLSPADASALKRSGELIGSGDLRSLVSRLRAAGYSPALIRAIVSAQVSEQFILRRNALIVPLDAMSYWKGNQGFPFDPKASLELNALSREQSAMLKDLLGPDSGPTDELSRRMQERRFGHLSKEKIDRIERIMSDYNDLRSKINADIRGVFLPQDQQKFTLLENEQRADLVKLLSPEELEDYDLRVSPTANMLRNKLGAFNATEDEFKLLYRLNAPVDQMVNSLQRTAQDPGGNYAVAERQIQEARKQLEAQIDSALGPARAAEYREAIDPAYQQATRLLTRLDLPTTLARDVVSVQKDIQRRASDVQQNRALTTAERTTQLTALAQEAQAKLTATLGESGYTIYRGYSGGWISTLTPRPPTPPKK